MKLNTMQSDIEPLEETDSIYSKTSRELLVEADEISLEEEGFMFGWEQAG